jgi:hypothetical protein
MTISADKAALEAAITGEVLEKGIQPQTPGNPMQYDGENANGGLQKSDDEDEDDDEEDEDEDEGDNEDAMEKSLRELLGDDDSLRKSIDAVPVLEAFVDGMDEVVAGLRDQFAKSFAEQNEVNSLLVRALTRLASDNRDMADMVKSMHADLAALANRPVQRKAAVAGAPLLEKSLGAAPVMDDPRTIQQKLIKAISAGALPMSIAHSFDASGMNPAALPPHVLDTIKNY